ncbi:MAG TPA: hypothetical protein VF657_13670 [Actinoplanes sp.]|jgi:hypothetical protein
MNRRAVLVCLAATLVPVTGATPASAHPATGITLPTPGGPLPVGTTIDHLVDVARRDPGRPTTAAANS